MPTAVCVGELLINFVPAAREARLQQCPPLIGLAGGAPAVVAVGLARLGVETGFVGKVGDDPFGSFLRETLARNSVDTAHLRRAAEALTMVAFSAAGPEGRQEILLYRNSGADALLQPEEIDEDYIASASVLHFGGLSLTRSPGREATPRAIEIAQEHGLCISCALDLQLMLKEAPGDARRWMWRAISAATVVRLAEQEWKSITGVADLEAGSRRILDRGPQLVVVTRGEQGCYYDNGRARGYLPGFSVEAVDPLGAGEGFVVAMLSALLTAGDIGALGEDDLDELLTLANAAGALTTQRAGIISALPTHDEIRAFVRTASFRLLAIGDNADSLWDDDRVR